MKYYIFCYTRKYKSTLKKIFDYREMFLKGE